MCFMKSLRTSRLWYRIRSVSAVPSSTPAGLISTAGNWRASGGSTVISTSTSAVRSRAAGTRNSITAMSAMRASSLRIFRATRSASRPNTGFRSGGATCSPPPKKCSWGRPGSMPFPIRTGRIFSGPIISSTPRRAGARPEITSACSRLSRMQPTNAIVPTTRTLRSTA